MAFLETPRFPDDLAAWATGGPVYSTTIVVLNSGHEQRNQNWAQARSQWDISGGLRTAVQVVPAIAFFRSVKGREHGFRFKDFFDFEASVSNGALIDTTASPTPRVKQLVKNYTSGALGEVRTIRKPVSAGFQLFNSAVLMTVGAGASQYTIDFNTGRVTLGTGLGATVNYTWSGTFDVPCRFDVDEMKGRREAQGGFYEWDPIIIVEIRV